MRRTLVFGHGRARVGTPFGRDEKGANARVDRDNERNGTAHY